MSGGRPSKLTPELQARLVQATGEWLPAMRAAELVGITYTTLKRWMASNEEFRAAIKAARAQAQTEVLAEIRVGKPGWQSRCWLLERSDHEHWGRKDGLQQAKPPPPADKTKAEYEAMPSAERIALHRAAIEEETQKLEGRH